MIKKTLFVLMLALLVVNLVSAESLRVTLLTPSATFRVNQSDIINYYVQVRNMNSFPVDIDIQNVSGINFDGDNRFILNPNETRKLEFSYQAYKKETVLIPVVFSTNNQSFALTESLNIDVTTKNPEISNPNKTSNIILIFFVLIMIVLFSVMGYIIFKRVKGGNKQ